MTLDGVLAHLDLEREASRRPLKRLGRPADVAALAMFLLSKEASWITGQTLAVDGGAECL